MPAKSKKKHINKSVNLHHVKNDEAGSVPESNVVNLREVLLQREVEKLKGELDKKKRSTSVGKIKHMFSSSGPKSKKIKEPKEVEPPETETFIQPKKIEKAPRQSLKVKFS